MRLITRPFAVLATLLALALVQACFSQSGKAAIMHLEEFFHPERGIKRLVRALKELDPDFYSRPFEVQQEQFLKMDDICFPEKPQKVEAGEQVKKIVCPVMDDIVKHAEMFAKKRKIKQLFDIHDGVGVVDVSKMKDVTDEFINEFNRSNP